MIEAAAPGVPNARWIAIRLLDGDDRVERALRTGELPSSWRGSSGPTIASAGRSRCRGHSEHDSTPAIPVSAATPSTARTDADAESVIGARRSCAAASRATSATRRSARSTPRPSGSSRRVGQRAAASGRAAIWDQRIDRIVTSPIFGLPLMLLILAVVFWLTIAGANVPSAMLASGFFWFEDQAAALFDALGAPWWLTGFIWHGVYRGLAWVISVMLPPMAIFFPLFTILEDLGYLPRVAFNLDFLFKRAGAHGKQALTMAMGFGCNAAGVIATRVIDSPRERLVAILTNNFVPCNGRFPTLIMLATIFVAARVPAGAGVDRRGRRGRRRRRSRRRCSRC